MKYLSILLFLIFLSCNQTETTNEEQIIKKETKEEHIANTDSIVSNTDKLKKLYLKIIKPVYTKAYSAIEIPTVFKIDSTDSSINAGAAFGYVEVSKGLVDCKDQYIQVFTLCHELGHIVTIDQAQKFNLGSEIPNGKSTNAYKKAEYIADLIAFHLISESLPQYKETLYNNLNRLENLLGHSDSYTHPSGPDRIKSLKKYKTSTANSEETFKKLFEYLWKMD